MQEKKAEQINKDSDTLWAPGLSPGRIEALTDGTFAIAMTILVLELPVPLLLHSAVAGENPASFAEMWAEFYIYGLGFIVLGIYWVLHHYMFHFIKRADGILSWLTILFLAFAALVPFSTKALHENQALVPGGPWSNAVVFFAATTAISILLLLAIWRHATQKHRLVDLDIDPRIVSALSRVIIVGVAVFVIGTILSFYATWAGYIGFFAMAFMIVMTVYGKFSPGFGKNTVNSRG